MILAKKVIIATGGSPKDLQIEGIEYCLNSDQIMELKKITKEIIYYRFRIYCG